MKKLLLALALVALLPRLSYGQASITSVDLGKRTDSAVTGDNAGTLIGHIRYLDKVFADIWDSANHRLKIAVDNGSLTDTNTIAVATLQATALATGAGTECPIVSAASTNSTSCKASPGNLYGVELYNTTTTVYYLRLYNSSGAPTCSSATGFIRSIPIPPASAAGQIGGLVRQLAMPVNYGTGIGYCITAGSSSTDNNAAVTGLLGALLYK